MTTSQQETKYCLESNFIINLLNGKDEAVKVFEEIKNSTLCITAIASVTLFEILRGKEKNQEKVARFESLLIQLEVLPFGKREAEEASLIEKTLHQRGESISSLDLLIGTTAKCFNTILVSNDRIFDKIDGLRVRTY
ncbi:MAG: type II toxin-antitoxin system VapC family toxin [Candidatus Paceibacterota bacterium]